MPQIINRLKLTIITTTGYILILSLLLAIITWNVAPVLFPDIPTSRNNSYPIESIKLLAADLNEKADFDQISIKTWVEPKKIQSNKEVELFLEIFNSSGQPTSLDTSIHYTRIHTYAVRADLGGSTLHLHPTETSKNSGIWRTLVTFPSSGNWHLVSQTSKKGVVYQITSAVEVEGKTVSEFIPDFSRNKELQDWNVTLIIDEDPIIVGEPVRFTFDLIPKPGTDPPKLEGSKLDNGHNFILSRVNDPLIWNQHGDSSVEKISEKAGLPVKRIPTEEHPFSHVVTFPTAGVWLLHFEVQSNPIHFFVDVRDKV